MKTLAAPAEQGFVLGGMDWELYEALLERIGDRHVFVTYDRGSLEIMSPSREHEVYARLIGRFIAVLALELDIPIASGGMTTFRRKDLDRGLEPDDCYWIQNEARIRGKKRVDLSRDPPPDLAIEVEISRRLLDREGIYASLRIPEVWCYDGHKLKILGLVKGRHRVCEASLALPMLPPAVVERFLRKLETTDETSVLRAFQMWVRKTLVKPARGRAKGRRSS